MKKYGKLWSTAILIILVLGVTACKNWMTGGLFSNVQEEVKIATAEKVDIYVRFADNSFGTSSPSGLVTKKVDVSFDLTAVTDKEYGFYKWTAFSSENINPKKNTPALVYDEDYFIKYEPLEISDSIVKFEDPYSETTRCKIFDNRPDIVIVPVVAKRATLYSRNTYPKVGAEDVVRNQRIVISFDKKIDFSSVVKCTNPGEVFSKDEQGNNIYYTKNSSGEITQYFYTWDYDKILIQVYDGNGNALSEEQSFAFFNLPVPDEKDARKIIITPNKDSKLPRYAQVDITIYKGVVDYAGYNLKDNETYYYTVGKSDDDGYPVFTELKGGRPRELSLDDIRVGKNTWSDFYGYMDPTNATDFRPLDTIPDGNSTDISKWANSGRNNPFVHRVSNVVDLCVIIHDTSDSKLTENKNISDQDIEKFTVRSKHLLYPDGTPGTFAAEKIYTKTDGYSYDALKYHSGGKNFSDKEPGNRCDDPDDGYAFPYYFPEDLPDGLVKIELFAEDPAGNSGEAKPFAMYVIKDTTSPDISSQSQNIEPVKGNTLDKWYNATTIEQLKFKLKDGKTIVDTTEDTSNKGAMIPQHSKFTNSTGNKVYWGFGASSIETIKLEEVKTDSVYEMKGKIPSGLSAGAVTFFSSLSDDLGNTSVPTPVTMDVWYDNKKPENTELVPPEDDGSRLTCYPTTKTSGGSEVTYYSPFISVNITLSGTDDKSLAETNQSSGVAGYLVKNAEQTAQQLASAMANVENGVLKESGFVLSKEAEYKYAFNTGAANSNTPVTYWIYTVDNALNVSATPTKLNVAHDTKGPDIVVSDKASKNYSKEKQWYKSSESENNAATSDDGFVAGTVQGLPSGILYYNKSEDGFPLNIELKNSSDSLDSGAYYFLLKDNRGYTKSENKDLTKKDFTVESGIYQIVALDNLGNETRTAYFTVKQDETEPEITDVKIHGKDQNNADTTSSTITDEVYVSFSANDTFTGKVSTGILSLTLSGDADFSNATLSASTLTASGYEKSLSSSNNEVTFIIKEPGFVFTDTKVENIKLNAGDGNKDISVSAQDRSRNQSSGVKASIFIDNTPPTLEDLKLHSTIDTASDGTDYRYTRSTQVKLSFISKDLTSGVKKIYVTNNSLASGGKSLLLFASKVDGTNLTTDANGIHYLERNSNTLYEFELPKITLKPSGVSISEGEQTVYVTVFDDAGNKIEKTVSILYDTQGPQMTTKEDSTNPFRIEYPSGSGDFIRNEDKDLIIGNNGWGVDKNELVFSVTEKTSGIEAIEVNSFTDKNNFTFRFTSGSKIYVNGKAVDCSIEGNNKRLRLTNRETPDLLGENLQVRLTNLVTAYVEANSSQKSPKYTVSLTLYDFAGNKYEGGSAANYAAMIRDEEAPKLDPAYGLNVKGNIVGETKDGVLKKITKGQDLSLSVTALETTGPDSGWGFSTGIRNIVLENGTFQDNVAVTAKVSHVNGDLTDYPISGEKTGSDYRNPNDAENLSVIKPVKISKPADWLTVKRNEWKFWLSDNKKVLYFVTPLSFDGTPGNLSVSGVQMDWDDISDGSSKTLKLCIFDTFGNMSGIVRETFEKDTTAPVITEKKEPYTANNLRLYDKDADTVYYSKLYASYEFNDSYLQDFVFCEKDLSKETDTGYTWTEIPSSKISNEKATYDFTDIETRLPEGHSNQEIWLNVRDKMGNISSIQLKHNGRTKWIGDSTGPTIETNVYNCPFYGETAESRFKIVGHSKEENSNNYYRLYKNSSVTDQTVNFASNGQYLLSKFFTDSGSGLYGWSVETDLANADINKATQGFEAVPAVEGKSIVIYDNVGGYNYFDWTIIEDSLAPVISLTGDPTFSVTGKNIYKPVSGISTDSANPTNIYIQSTDTADYIEIPISFTDPKEEGTGKESVGIRAVIDESGNSLGITSAGDFECKYNWRIGEGVAKSESTPIQKSLTVSDYVGHETTCYVNIISDVTPPSLSPSEDYHAPFVKKEYDSNETENLYYTTYDDANKRSILVAYGSSALSVSLSGSGIVDGGTSGYQVGLPDSIVWYSDSGCKTALSGNKITVTPKTGAPTVSPSTVYTKDKLGNVLSVPLNSTTMGSVRITSGTVVTSEKVDSLTLMFNGTKGQAFKVANNKVSLCPGLGLPSASRTVYINSSSATVSLKLEENDAKKYRCSVKGSNTTWTSLNEKTFTVNVQAGRTYVLEIGSLYNKNYSVKYEFSVVQDSDAPTITDSLFPFHEFTSSEKYYTDGTYTDSNVLGYNQKIYIADDTYEITLPETGFEDSTAVFGFSNADNVSFGSPYTKQTLSNGTVSFGLYDWLGNGKKINLEVIKPAVPAIKAASLAVSDTSDPNKKLFSDITTGTDLSGSYTIGTNDTSVVLELNTVSDLDGVQLSVSTGGTVSGTTVTLPSSNSGSTYTITATDKLQQTKSITVKVEKDATGPVFKTDAAYVPRNENLSASSPYVNSTNNYWCDGTAGEKNITVYSKESSVSVLLADPSTAATDPSGVFWADSLGNVIPAQSGVTSVSVTAGSPVTVKTVDNFGNESSDSIKITLVQDTQAPTFDSSTGKAEVIFTEEGGDASKLAQFYSSGNTIYYSRSSLCRLYMNVSGLSDESSGVFLAGLAWGNDVAGNPGSSIPGNGVAEYSDWDSDITGDITDSGERSKKAKTLVKEGIAKNVFLTFKDNPTEFYLYVRDKAGNIGHINFNFVQDTDPPAVGYSGDDAVMVKDGSTIYLNGKGTLNVLDVGSGLKTNTDTEIRDNLGNGYTVVTDTTNPSVTSASYDNSDQHKYTFTVTEAGSGISKIIIKNASDTSQFSVYDNNLGVTLTKSVEGSSVILTLSSPKVVETATEFYIKAYYGDQILTDVPGAPSDTPKQGFLSSYIQVVDVVGNTGYVGASATNQSVISRLTTGLSKAGTAITKKTSSVIRTVFFADSSAERTSVTGKVSEVRKEKLVSEKVQVLSENKKESRKQLKKVSSDIRKLVETEVPAENAAPIVEEISEEILEKKQNTVLTESQVNSKNVVKQENNIDNYGNDIYNENSITKSFTILSLLLLLLICCTVVFIKTRKNKK